jgi:ribonuclease D
VANETHQDPAPRGADDDGRELSWVERSADLLPIVADIGDGPLAVDSEADSFHHYRERVCLIQLSYGRRDVLVDTLALTDLKALEGVLGDPELRKILHGADYDVRLFRRDCGLVVRGLFDTMVAARLVGERAFGLAALLERHLNVRLDKRFQRADWSVRPLPPEMARYAMLDTRHLATLAEILETRLERLGRLEWAAEEFRRVEQVRWEGERNSIDAWRRVKGVRTLEPRELAVLREVALLRERAARERNVPPFRVARDPILIELAKQARLGPDQLGSLRGLPRPWTRGGGARALQSAIDRGLELDERDWPAPPPSRRGPRRSRESEARVRRMARERDRVAETLGLEPSVLASRSVLERVLDQLDQGLALEDVAELRSWQLEQLETVVAAGRSG